MNRKLVALVSALAAAMAAASAAEAGGGVRLGFGAPLGSFVATPAHGGGSGAYRKGHQKQAAKHHKAAPAKAAARKPDKPAPRVAKAAPPKAETAKPGAAAVTETETEDTPRLTGSSALIQPQVSASEAEGDAVETPSADVAPVTADAGKPAADEEDCKKFIPAIGMTVSVGCGE